MSCIAFRVVMLVAALCAVAQVEAGTVQFQLGEQDFADGKTPILSREIREAGVGEVYPFNGTIFGHDMKRELGAFDYTHGFDLGGAKAVSAKLTIGLIDIDSPADHPYDTLSILFNGVAQPTDLLRGISMTGSPSSVEVVDIPVPVELLASGALHVSIAAKMAGFANLGNAIEADFSRLVVETAAASIDPMPIPVPGGGEHPHPIPVPLPPEVLPAGMILAGLAVIPRRRFRQWMRI